MSTVRLEQEKTKLLVKRVAESGCGEAFHELEWLAKPLMTHLADYYSSLHYKFEFEDFYAICLNALYEACLEYDPKNPSFLSYSKTFMVNQCNRELEYWNAEMRNIFTTQEIMVGLEREIQSKDSIVQFVTVEDEVNRNELWRNINQIISYAFDDNKADIMRLYIMYDMRPVDIAEAKHMEYQSTYSIIKRGMKKIANEYKRRYSLDIIEGI